jgi:beta-galactosidase
MDNYEVEIWNRYDFTNLKNISFDWMIEEDGINVQNGSIDLDIPPLSKERIKIPMTKPELKPGAHYTLLMEFGLKKDEIWAKTGHLVAWDQLDLPWFTPSQTQIVDNNLPALKLIDVNDRLQINGKDFSYSFDKKTGKIASLNYLGKELIKQGAKLNLFRAPLANELDDWAAWGSNMLRPNDGFGNTIAGHWFKPGIDHLIYTLEKLTYSQSEKQVSIEVNELAAFSNDLNSGFENKYIYSIKPSGEITICHTLIPNGNMPAWLPRVGVVWILDNSMQMVEWYGRGPQENYPDRKTGSQMGVYKSTVDKIYEPYLIPQDYGLRSDNYWVKITDEQGIGLKFSGNRFFNFNIYPYSTDNLTKAKYPFQLQKSDGITFNFDYKTTGVGCTARSTFNQYRTLPERYDFITTIVPVTEIIR